LSVAAVALGTSPNVAASAPAQLSGRATPPAGYHTVRVNQAGFVTVRDAQAPSPEIEVLSAGAAPREALRLAPAVGASQRAAMTVRLGLEQSGVSSASVNVPPIRATLAATLRDATPNGDFHVSVSYPSFEVLKGNGTSAAQRRAAERTLTGLEMLSGELTLTTRGALVDSNFNIPPGLDPTSTQILGQLGDQLRGLTAPLPEPAIGVGARWRVTTHLTISGIQLRQVYEYKLKKRKDTTLELEVRGTQTAKRQAVDLPGVPSGVKVRVTSFKVTFRGAITMDLTRLLPVAGHLRAGGDQTFHVEAKNESGTLRQHVKVRVAIEPA
jgi:hypothetical protein